MEELTMIVRGYLSQEGPRTLGSIAARLGLDQQEVGEVLNQAGLFSQEARLWSVIEPTEEDLTRNWEAIEHFFNEYECIKGPPPDLSSDGD